MRIALFYTNSVWPLEVVNALLKDGLDEILLFEAATDDLSGLARARHAARFGARRIVVSDVRSDQCAVELESFLPDLLLAVTFPAKLPDRLLSVPSLAAVNVHPSLLPRYRGAQPEFWVIRNGEKESGVSLHRMTRDLDAGELISQHRFDLAIDETLGTICEKLALVATSAVRSFLSECRRGVAIRSEPQDHSRATHAPRVAPQHLLISWKENSSEIERLVRACFPYFDPRAKLGEREIVIRKCSVGAHSDLAVGQCRSDRAGVIAVGTTDRTLVLEQIED